MAGSNKGLTQIVDRNYNCIASVIEIRKTNRRQKYKQAIKKLLEMITRKIDETPLSISQSYFN